MRDHHKLKAYELADNLAIKIYEMTADFPRSELFGLSSQMRRSAVSIPSNIVEGSARHTKVDYIHFLDIDYGSSRELQYQLSLAHRLGFIGDEKYKKLNELSTETSKVLNGLIRSLREAKF